MRPNQSGTELVEGSGRAHPISPPGMSVSFCRMNGPHIPPCTAALPFAPAGVVEIEMEGGPLVGRGGARETRSCWRKARRGVLYLPESATVCCSS